eukprot:maker-scaffold160_size295910-snap-gene-1.32 protein:Tk01229 transcript:maker-scaffold160_size295910-snap-gene-1.32-mRNA-1 annotation:"conserved hypothetical protein"
MAHRGNGMANGRAMDGHRTPNGWQQREASYNSQARGDTLENRYTEYPRGRSPASRQQQQQQRSSSNPRYGGPSTPNSAHSRSTTKTPDQRRPVRGSSSERFSQHSTGRKVSSRESGGGRSSRGHARSSPYKGSGYSSRSHHSPSSTEETAEETTETDSQAPTDAPRNDYHRQMYGIPPPGYALAPMSYTAVQPQMMGPMAPPQLMMAPNGSIRSVQSVPMLAAAPTWDGEPCPVHHGHPPMPMPAAFYGMGQPAISMGPPSVPPSVVSGATT